MIYKFYFGFRVHLVVLCQATSFWSICLRYKVLYLMLNMCHILTSPLVRKSCSGGWDWIRPLPICYTYVMYWDIYLPFWKFALCQDLLKQTRFTLSVGREYSHWFHLDGQHKHWYSDDDPSILWSSFCMSICYGSCFWVVVRWMGWARWLPPIEYFIMLRFLAKMVVRLNCWISMHCSVFQGTCISNDLFLSESSQKIPISVVERITGSS